MNRSRLGALMIGGGLALVPVSIASPAFADTTVSARPPVFVDQAGTDNDSYVVPSVTGVSYYMSSVKINPGTRKVDAATPFVEVFTAADPGFTLSSPATWSHQFASNSDVSFTVDGKKVDTLQAALDIQEGRTPSTATATTTATSTSTTTATSTGTGSTVTATGKSGGYRTAQLGDLVFGAQNASTYTHKSEKPSNGKFVSVDVSVKNTGSSDQSVLPTYSVALIDGSGTRVAYAPGSDYVSKSTEKALVSVKPSTTARGEMIFDVSKSFKAKSIEFSNPTTKAAVVIPLTADPSASDDELPHTGLSDALPIGGAMLLLAVAGGLLWRRSSRNTTA